MPLQTMQRVKSQLYRVTEANYLGGRSVSTALAIFCDSWHAESRRRQARRLLVDRMWRRWATRQCKKNSRFPQQQASPQQPGLRRNFKVLRRRCTPGCNLHPHACPLRFLPGCLVDRSGFCLDATSIPIGLS